MIASAQTLRALQPVKPFIERTRVNGMSAGLSAAGYDVTVDGTTWLYSSLVLEPGQFELVSTFETFEMPTNLLGIVHDKSTWARLGIAVQNTVIEPGWKGYLTLEITNHSKKSVTLIHGDPIAQIVFHLLDVPTDAPYTGKYQNQESGPQKARFE